MLDSFEELLREERNNPPEVFYNPPPRKKEKIVNHTTLIGKLVYDAYGKTATPLLYMAVNNLSSAMLQKNFNWWLVEERIRRILEWGQKKNARPQQLVVVFNKAIKKLSPEKI